MEKAQEMSDLMNVTTRMVGLWKSGKQEGKADEEEEGDCNSYVSS